jgi:S-phase kinase-associated protein 1
MSELSRPLKGNLEDAIDAKDKEFLSDWDESITVSMVKASAFLNCPELHQLSCAKLASLLLGKSIEEIRVTLGVQNDFSPEEEAALRKEHGMEL